MTAAAIEPVPWVGVCEHCAQKYGDKALAGFIFFMKVHMACFHCGKDLPTLDKSLLEMLGSEPKPKKSTKKK